MALAALLAPVATTAIAPLLDYPNHIARMWLLAGGADHPALRGMYAVDWSGAWTNVGADLLAAWVGPWVGIGVLAPAVLGAGVLLPPLGAVVLNRAVFGGWHWWQVGFAVLAWNATLVAGFLNFQAGIGLALLAAGLDPLARGAGSRWLVPVRMAVTAVLIAWHPFAAGFYGVLLAGLAFGPGRWRDGFPPRAWRAMRVAGPAVGLPVAAFLLLAPTLPGGHAPPGAYDTWGSYSVGAKIATLLTPVVTYDLPVDALAVLLLYAAGRLVGVRALARAHGGLLLGAAGALALALLTPPVVGGTACVDWRFPVMAVLTAVAAFRPELRTTRAGQTMAVALLVLALGRTGWITSVWHERQADVAAVRDALSLVPASASVLPVSRMDARDPALPVGRTVAWWFPSYGQLGTLAVPWRQAFVPTLFTAPGKQPLRVLPPWASFAALESPPASVKLLHTYAPSARDTYLFGYFADWRRNFQYVLVLNADMPNDPDETTVPGLALLADRGFARLYAVRPDAR